MGGVQVPTFSVQILLIYYLFSEVYRTCAQPEVDQTKISKKKFSVNFTAKVLIVFGRFSYIKDYVFENKFDLFFSSSGLNFYGQHRRI